MSVRALPDVPQSRSITATAVSQASTMAVSQASTMAFDLAVLGSMFVAHGIGLLLPTHFHAGALRLPRRARSASRRPALQSRRYPALHQRRRNLCRFMAPSAARAPRATPA